MKENYHTLDDLLDDCTVRVQTKDGHGTGFFVAPGLILTCAHVIKNALKENTSITVHYSQNTYKIEQIGETDVYPDSYPDLALLKVNFNDHQCVLLGTEYRAFIDFYSYGYTQDHPDGESTTVECEGIQVDGGTLIKLKEGQIKPGSSGSPLLNKKTGAVCGLISRTRGRSSDLGGVGVPMSTVFTKFPDLERKNLAFHRKDQRWTKNMLKEIGGEETSRAVAVLLYNELGKISKPKQFIGRDMILEEVNSLLDQSRRIVLTGMGGVGKTSIAQMVVEKRLTEKKADVIWVEVKDEQADVVIEAIADRLGDDKISNLNHIDERIQEMKKFLDSSEVSLLVLDNVQVLENSDDVEKISINQILKAIPEKLPVLITSRQRISIGEIIEVDLLAPGDALNLLEQTSKKKDLSSNQDALKLCEQLGYHPYALELAGAMMRELNRAPKELRRRLKDAPLNLSSPTRGKLRALLDDSVAGLDSDSRSVLYAFGAFLSTGATSTLVAAFLDQDVEDIFESLDRLERHNLVDRQPETEFYYLHDLTYYYVRSMTEPENEEDTQELVAAVIRYLAENRKDFDLIGLDLPNILAIAQVAKDQDLVKIMSYLTIGNYPLQEGKSYADKCGYSIGLIEQLDRAVDTAKDLGTEMNATAHYLLGKRGNAAFRRGEYQLAAEKYEQELLLSPDENRKAIVGGILSRTLAFCGRVDESRQGFLKAYELADKLKDDQTLNIVLGQESWAAGYLKDHATALQVAEKQLGVAENLYIHDDSNYERLINALINFGTAKLHLAGKTQDSTIEVLQIYERARQLAEKHGDRYILADVLVSLGEYKDFVEDRVSAQTYFMDALDLFSSLELIQGERELISLMQELGYSTSNL